MKNTKNCMAKPIMIQGTMSGAGKSLLVAGVCRCLYEDGYQVAPFKSQNMALNSFVTEDGLEMGRAQVMQAEAAGRKPVVEMNPILLKPTSDTGSQVIVNGKVVGTMPAKEYFSYKKSLLPQIKDAYGTLAEQVDVIVIEGAGSPAEINLKQDDIVNMGMAKLADAPVLLVGDIDRGGVFAQLYGTVALLEEEERKRIKGLIINKFRGDLSILTPGIRMLEEKCGIPVFGVVPYLPIELEAEDSLSNQLQENANKEKTKQIQIAVIQLKRISNFTDFDVFSRMEEVSLVYVKHPSQLAHPDAILLPGTKNTADDLLLLRQNGLEAAILKEAAKGTPIFGICGGYQMLGEEISDESNMESGKTVRGMGLLPGKTAFLTTKTRTQVHGVFENNEGFFSCFQGLSFHGYEIHMGETTFFEKISPLVQKETNEGSSIPDGCVLENVCGTYVHGIFDEEGVAEAFVLALAKKKGITLKKNEMESYAAYKERQFSLLGEGIRKSGLMKHVYRLLEEQHES